MVTKIPYPKDLPLPQSNFSGSAGSPNVVTQFTSGRRRRRKIGRTMAKVGSLEWLFTPYEYDLWDAFYRIALDHGCSPFTINVDTGGSSQSGEHVVQLTSDYSYSYEECNWRVSVDCVVYPYPSMDEIGLLSGYLGMSLEDMERFTDMYYDRNYML